MKYRNNKTIGVIFVILGILFLLNNMNLIGIPFPYFRIGFILRKFWPAVFFILPGLSLHSVFFSGKRSSAGILVPAGILITIGVVLQLCLSFRIWGILLPGLILSVAVGLFELYLFGRRDKGLLIPVAILTITSLFFFDVFSGRLLFGTSIWRIIIPLALIVLGLAILLGNRSSHDGFR